MIDDDQDQHKEIQLRITVTDARAVRREDIAIRICTSLPLIGIIYIALLRSGVFIVFVM